jgi:hypothetical protein
VPFWNKVHTSSRFLMLSFHPNTNFLSDVSVIPYMLYLFNFFFQVYFASSIAIVIRDQAIVFTIHERRRDHEISRGSIAGNGNIPHNSHAQKRLDIGVVRLGLQWIPKEDKKIYLVVNDLCADLLVAP